MNHSGVSWDDNFFSSRTYHRGTLSNTVKQAELVLVPMLLKWPYISSLAARSGFRLVESRFERGEISDDRVQMKRQHI